MTSPGRIETDLLVVGSGIAGLSFALKACRYADVVLCTKKERVESNTNYAQGGVTAGLSRSWSERGPSACAS